MLLNPFNYHAPKSCAEAIKLYRELPQARFIAGGTFLVNQLKLMKQKAIKGPQNVISLNGPEDLRGIRMSGEELLIGAMTKISELINNELIKSKAPIIAKVAQNIGTTPIRNMGTVGGNLMCRYSWTEFGTVLLALNASLHFQGEKTEEAINAEDFLKKSAKTDLLLKFVSVPLEPKRKTAYFRLKKTLQLDLPILGICLAARINGKVWDDVRVAINNGVSFATRETRFEKFLESNPVNEKTADKIDGNIGEGTLLELGSDYKRHLLIVGLKQTINELARHD